MSVAPIVQSDVYKKFGRHTLAGKLMYNLYQGKEQNQYKANVEIITKPSDPEKEHREKIVKQASEGRKYFIFGLCMYIVKEKMGSVVLPKPVMPEMDQELVLRWKLAGAKKKTEKEIRKKMEQDFPTISSIKNRPSKSQSIVLLFAFCKPGLTVRQDKINQAQLLMEHRGQIPVKQEVAHSPIKRVEMDPDVYRIQELTQEISERESFLNDMKTLGQGKKYEATINGEIGERIREMKILEKKLSTQGQTTSNSPISPLTRRLKFEKQIQEEKFGRNYR